MRDAAYDPAGPVTRSRTSKSRPRRGLILPLVLVALAVALILGMCFLTSASTSTTLSSAVDHRLRARMIAESGLATALAYVEREHNNWRTDRAEGVWVTSQAMDGGTFTVSGNDGDELDATGAVIGDGNLADDASDPVTLTCVGVYGGARHLVRAVRYPPKAVGIAVNERVEVRKTGLIDSYDPKGGPYAAATATAAALARSNGLARQPYIKLRNSAQVNGNVYFGPGGSALRAVQQDFTAIVTGTTTALPTWVAMTDVAEPLWPLEVTGVNRAHSSGVTMLTSDLWCDNLNLWGTATLRVLGNVNLYVSDTLTVTDDARIDIGSPMAHGAAVKGAITISSTVPIDSYDSSLGPYGGTNLGAKALLATNSILAGAITVYSTVKGDAYTGVGSVPATSIVVTGSGSISGTRGALTSPMDFPAPPPWPTDVPASSGNLSFSNVDYTLAENLQTDLLQLTGTTTFRVSGHRKIRVNGDFRFDDNVVIDIPNDASLTLYVAGAVKMNGNGIVANTGKSPPRFIIYGMGSNPIDLIGNADLYAIIDAPNSAVSMGGKAVLYGAILAASLSVSNNAAIHNDRNPALVDTNPRLAASYTLGNKLTIYANKRTVLQGRAQVNAGARDPLLVTLNHLAPEPMDVTDNAVVYAETNVPETMLNIAGAAQWTGRIEARNLSIGGTAIVTADGSGGTSRPGIVVDETVEVKDSAIVNGAGGLDLLASNGTTDTTIWVKDSAVFKGDGYTAPDGNPIEEIRVAPAATFTGTKSALTLPVPIAALTPPAVAAPVGERLYSGTTTTRITGVISATHFRARDTATVEVEGATRVVLTGDFKFSHAARLILLPGATLTVYCPGNVLIAGNAQVNVGGDPARFVLSCPVAPEVVVRETGRLCTTLLAPMAELKLTTSAEFYGAFAGRRVKVDNAAKFHCAQGQIGPITWLEQQ